MVRLTRGHRRLVANHLPELANFAAGSFLFGQVLTDRPYSPLIALIGIVSWAVLFAVAMFFARGE